MFNVKGIFFGRDKEEERKLMNASYEDMRRFLLTDLYMAYDVSAQKSEDTPNSIEVEFEDAIATITATDIISWVKLNDLLTDIEYHCSLVIEGEAEDGSEDTWVDGDKLEDDMRDYVW